MKYILPLKQPQTSLTTTFTTNSKPFTSTFTTTITKSPPKSKIPFATSSKPEKFSEKHHSHHQTTTTQTKIPALMNISNTSLPTRFRMRTTRSSSITIPLSSSISPSLIFLSTLQELQQSGLSGVPPLYLQQQSKKVTITWRF